MSSEWLLEMFEGDIADRFLVISKEAKILEVLSQPSVRFGNV